MTPIPFQDYIICNVPEGALKVLAENGYPEPQGPTEIKEATDLFIKEKGDEAVLALAAIHPDRELIINADIAAKNGIEKLAYQINFNWKKLPAWAQLVGWSILGYGAISCYFKRKGE